MTPYGTMYYLSVATMPAFFPLALFTVLSQPPKKN
jgi:hypothetical protein